MRSIFFFLSNGEHGTQKRHRERKKKGTEEKCVCLQSDYLYIYIFEMGAAGMYFGWQNTLLGDEGRGGSELPARRIDFRSLRRDEVHDEKRRRVRRMKQAHIKVEIMPVKMSGLQ